MVAKIEKDRDIETPRFAWIVGVVAWAIPGAGHFLQKRWLRGALGGGAVFLMFFVGIWLGGYMSALTGQEQGFAILYKLVPMSANVGIGLPYVFCWLANIGFTEHHELVTSEYGWAFLLVAGLLNYLVMLDAFDIAAGRKP